MSDFADRILADLRGFAAELVEPGLAPSSPARSAAASTRSGERLMRMVREFDVLAREAVGDLEEEFEPSFASEQVTHVPVRATLSRRPSDYRFHGDRLVPVRWVREGEGQRRQSPLRWLAWLLTLLRAELRGRKAGYETWVRDAVASRDGTSVYATRDLRTLSAILDGFESQEHVLERSSLYLMRVGGGRVVPNRTAVQDLPRTPSWLALRRLAAELIHPEKSLPAHLAELLRAPVEVADLPYLYQRWCGLQLVRAFEACGWQRVSAAVGPLFLGGEIKFRRGGTHAGLWVEPRLVRGAVHPSGWQSVGDESTPDFLAVVPGAGRPLPVPAGGRAASQRAWPVTDAFVVDATLSTDPDTLSGKAKYLRTIASGEMRLVAGIPTYAKPVRSWAMAPIGGVNRVTSFGPTGAHGVIPAHPVAWNPRPLAAWTADVTDHALAWSREESAGQEALSAVDESDLLAMG